ncbi:MAG: alpha/beta hydrolase [Candidatus Omnitrophica bacterium]|nr:alpha/beta hydrolase [Candidatus Omnitrophota bacterium]
MQIISFLIIAVVVMAAGVRYLENQSVFYPVRGVVATPAALGLPFEDVFLKTRDNVSIHGWLVKSTTARGMLLFLHGNAGNIGDRLGKIQMFHQMGFHVFIIDYRGYGKSQGRPSETGIYLDALAAYDYLRGRPDIASSKIVGYGESLGGAVVVDLAAKRELAALIVDSSFTNAADMAKLVYPFVPSFLIKTKLDSIGKIRAVTAPKLLLHSREDELVPFALGEKLYQAAADPKEFLEITGGHNTGFDGSQEKMLRGVTDFLRRNRVIE